MVTGLMKRITAYAPGSTSNVGPGFDCLGIALEELGDRVTAEQASAPGVRVRSVSDPRIPADAHRNTAALAATEVLKRAGATDLGLELEVEKGLPLAGGLGGSAASAVAGAVAADALLPAPLGPGGLLECALVAEAEVAGARALLPVAVARPEAVAQAAALAGLVVGLERGDGELIGASMIDRIAEPGRTPLYPGYAEAREAALGAGAWGVAVSGAGPTLVAVAPDDRAVAVGEAAAAVYTGLGGQPAKAHVAGVDGEGARIL
jgi:homoserine kinase